MWVGSNFVRALGSTQWQTDAAANVGIQAGIHDTADNDLATGIDNTINKNGANTPTANLSMGGFAHTNVAAATIRTQYAQVAQVQTGTYNFQTSGGSANAQTLTLAPALTAHTLGTTVWFRAGFTNTTNNPTLNVNGLGALQILRPNTGGLYAGDITAGYIYNATVVDGTYWILNNPTPKWNTWSPTVAAVVGSLSAPTLSAKYVVDVGGTVNFNIGYSGTLSSGPTGAVTFGTPVTAADTNAAWGGRAQSTTPANIPAFAYFGSTSSITIINPTDWADGTLVFNVSGSYQSA